MASISADASSLPDATHCKDELGEQVCDGLCYVCRFRRSRVEQLPYQAELHPIRMLSAGYL